jgi:primosomal replication protein N
MSTIANSVSTINTVMLVGRLVERDALRFTPAGIALLNAKLAHQSEQTEAGGKRSVEFEIELLFAGEAAVQADRLVLGQHLSVSGFLAHKRRQSRTLQLHATGYELVSS